MGRIKANDELYSDKTKNPVVRDTYVLHGNQWLDEVVDSLATDTGKKANKDYVDAELAKKANVSTVTELTNTVNTKANASTVTELTKTVDTKASAADVTVLQTKTTALETTVSGKADNTTVSSLSERVTENTTKTVDLQSQIDSLVIEAGGDSNPEVVQARTDASGVTHATLKSRIDSEVTDLKSDLSEIEEYNCFDVISDIPREINVKSGISFDWTGNSCYVHGTATGNAINNIYYSESSLPKGIKKGEKYYLYFNNNGVDGLKLRIGSFNGTWNWKEYSVNTHTEYVVPDDAIGMSIRLYVYTGTVVNTSVNPILLNSSSNQLLTKNVAELYTGVNSSLKHTELDGTDLNNATVAGTYVLRVGTEYTNSPVPKGNRRVLFVYRGGSYVIQQFTSFEGTKGIRYMVRYFADGAWSEWIDMYGELKTSITDVYSLTLKHNQDIPTDLNDAVEAGTYVLGYSATYENCPIPNNSRRVLFIYQGGSYIAQQLICYEGYAKQILFRYRAGGVWSGWTDMYSDINAKISAISEGSTKTLTDIHSAHNNTHANTGREITVMSYNICNFNNDTSTYISDAKLTNVKKLLYKANADFIGLQENGQYVDGASKPSRDYLYYPIYPYVSGNSGVVLASRKEITNNAVVSYSNGRGLRYAICTYDNKKLLIVSTHPVSNQSGTGSTSEESIAARNIQYKQLFQFIHHEVTLENIDTRTQVSCPEWDWCVICMDANSITDTDRAALKLYAEARNFSMANGDYIGWLETCKEGIGIDNIIVSSNVIINSVEVKGDMYSELYSDHYPMIAKLTLCDD